MLFTLPHARQTQSYQARMLPSGGGCDCEFCCILVADIYNEVFPLLSECDTVKNASL